MHVPSGAILTWLAVGVDPPGGINPPWPYETISTIEPNHNLRLHSNQGIYFHTGNRRDPTRGVDAGGNWWNASSREIKENIRDFSFQEAAEILSELTPVKFAYAADQQKKPHVGFIAEEVPDIIGSPDKKMISDMNILAVLTKVVQEQQQSILGLQEELRTMKSHAPDMFA